MTPTNVLLTCAGMRGDMVAAFQAALAREGAGGVVGLLSRGPEQHVQGIANDLCHRAVMGKNDVGHAGEILIEQRSKDAWV